MKANLIINLISAHSSGSEAQFEKALAIQPTNKDVLTNLRMLHTQIGEYDKAKELKEKIEALGN